MDFYHKVTWLIKALVLIWVILSEPGLISTNYSEVGLFLDVDAYKYKDVDNNGMMDAAK